MPQGFALEPASTIEVIAAYSAPRTVVPAYGGNPESEFFWFVVGAFWLPRSCLARLDVLACVSNAALLSRCRLYDLVDLEEVSGSRASTSSLAPARILSGEVSLTGARMFQIHVDCILSTDGSPAADTDFAVVSTATISD